MNAQKHSLFWHDHAYDFALNFILSLLLEYGFRPKTESLELVNDLIFHLEKEKYLHSFIINPRSLKVSCRNRLRKHFRGRQIHWFVKQSNIPKYVEDFILLRPLLRANPIHLMS